MDYDPTLRIVIINVSIIIVRENWNNFLATNMCIVVYILCQQVNPYASIHVHMHCTPETLFNNIIFTHQLTFSESRYWTPHSRGHQFTFQNQDDPLLLFCSPSKLCSLWSVLPALACCNANRNTGEVYERRACHPSYPRYLEWHVD